jgi:excisionase family DNA binding protein
VRDYRDAADEALLTTGQVAKRLGVAPATVSAWVRQGVLTPFFRSPGGRNRFRWSEVEAQLRNYGRGPDES